MNIPLLKTCAALTLSITVLGGHANNVAATAFPTDNTAPVAIAATISNTCAQVYIVKAGDSLSAIAKRSTGNIFDYNNIVRITNDIAKSDKTFAAINNINLISIGQKLCLSKGIVAVTPAPVISAPVITKDAPASGAVPVAAHGLAHWGYEGPDGPVAWGNLSSEYATCLTGQEQSPINLTKANLRDVSNISFNYQPSKVNILNNGHTIPVNYDAGSYIVVDDKRYELLQYHFHAPSEHSVNGKLADAEVHFVHKAADGKLAVVGVLLVQGPENAALKNVWDYLPAKQGPAQTVSSTTNAKALLPLSATSYRYNGSLTTPPCSEGVKWHVMTQATQMSAAQLKAFTNLFPISNRPLQPLNTRTLDLDSTP